MSLNSDIEKSYLWKYVTMDNWDIIYIKKFNYWILRTMLWAMPSSVSYYIVDEKWNIDKSEVYNMWNYEFIKSHYWIPHDSFNDINK